jgi:DNA-directed RNA polymerase subunit RPC12/RpoP
MKDPVYMKYLCCRCKLEITDSESDILVLKDLLSTKNIVYDFCTKCKKQFKEFLKGETHENN